LKILIDPKSLPSTGKGVLGWPLDKIIITQYFGTTAFSTQNPQVYNGKGHTGIDLGASIGTRIKASQNGIVAGTGDTDLIRGCYSYGKWVMIKHPNGLSTLYGHLSAITMKTGQEVTMGDTVGYSGNTGYSTGPHLHFGVYATAGVRIQPLANSKGCRNAVVPLADPSAYLNPLSYL
jgi:murein DD-endopeptidase MepM/ murein hydrolase activator NlpD